MAQPDWIIIHGLRHKESGRGKGPFWKRAPFPLPEPLPYPPKTFVCGRKFSLYEAKGRTEAYQPSKQYPRDGCGFSDPFNTLIALTISQTHGCGSLIAFKALSEYTVVLFSQYDETIDFLSNLFSWRTPWLGHFIRYSFEISRNKILTASYGTATLNNDSWVPALECSCFISIVWWKYGLFLHFSRWRVSWGYLLSIIRLEFQD